MCTSEYERIQEDKGYEADYLLNIDHALHDLDEADYEILARMLGDPGQMMESNGYFENHSTSPSKSQPSQAARIAMKYSSPRKSSQPSSNALSTTASTAPLLPIWGLPSPDSMDTSPSTSSAPALYPVQHSITTSELTVPLLTLVTPLATADMVKFPEWLKTWYINFSKLPYGQSWLKLVNKWTKLEKGYGFKSHSKSLTQCPDIIRIWSKSKFSLNHRPEHMPIHEISEKFWSWWAHLNAPVRICTTDDGPFYPGLNGEEIAIETLHMPGKNGWLGLLYVLKVWREWIEEGDATDWEIAVVDMEWVTLRLCQLTYYSPSIEVIPTLKRWALVHIVRPPPLKPLLL